MSAESVALKEWAVLVDALERGDILALIRKGGIREQRAGFSVRHERFLLYPTYFHENESELAERFRDRLGAAKVRQPLEGQIRLELLCEVVAVWRVTELGRLRAVADEHGLSWPAVETRFRYRDRPLVHVVAVRVSKLREPALIPETRRYLGCVSWVRLDQPIDVTHATPVLPSSVVSARVERLAGALGGPVHDDGAHDERRASGEPTRRE